MALGIARIDVHEQANHELVYVAVPREVVRAQPLTRDFGARLFDEAQCFLMLCSRLLWRLPQADSTAASEYKLSATQIRDSDRFPNFQRPIQVPEALFACAEARLQTAQIAQSVRFAALVFRGTIELE